VRFVVLTSVRRGAAEMVSTLRAMDATAEVLGPTSDLDDLAGFALGYPPPGGSHLGR